MGARKTLVTIESWRQLAQQEGYCLLSTIYINSRTHLDFLCPHGHTWKCSWDTWKQGNRCRQCYHETPRPTKYNVESINLYCKMFGYKTTLTSYKNVHDIVTFICPQGHQYQARWLQFKRGERCRRCQFDIMNIEKVRRALEAESYQLVSVTYTNPHKKLQSICPKGHNYNFAWAEFKKGYRCLQCAKEATTSKGETKLGQILGQIFGAKEIKPQDNLDFLGRLTVDYSVRSKHLAFEYDGEHHFRPTTFGGMSLQKAIHAFQQQQKRDQIKDQKCCQHQIRLIRIAYTEPLTIESIKEKIGAKNG